MNKLQLSCLVAMALAIGCAAKSAAAQSSPEITLRPATSTAPPPAASRPSSDALEAAKELVGVVSGKMISDMAVKTTAQIWPPIEASLRAQNPKLDAATSAELRAEFERLVVENVSGIMDNAPAIYARYLTAEEMRDLIAFYRTPTGAKALQVMPQILADSNAIVQQRLQGLQERVSLAFLNILQKRSLYAR